MNSYLERLRHEIDDAVGDTHGEALTVALPGKWNVAQILEHLFLTYKVTNRGAAKCLEGGVPLATPPTLKDRFATLLVVHLGYIPSGRKAPERAIPRGMPADEIQRAFASELQQMDVILEDCDRRFGASTKIMDHPFLGPLTANEWRRFHLTHGRHHARQIRQRRNQP